MFNALPTRGAQFPKRAQFSKCPGSRLQVGSLAWDPLNERVLAKLRSARVSAEFSRCFEKTGSQASLVGVDEDYSRTIN